MKLQLPLDVAVVTIVAFVDVVAVGQFCLFSWLVCQKVWPCCCLDAVCLLPRIAASLLTISRLRCRADVQLQQQQQQHHQQQQLQQSTGPNKIVLEPRGCFLALCNN